MLAASSNQHSTPEPSVLPWYRLRRSVRVCLLVFVVGVLSLADLYCTLLFLHNGGMGEANPVARFLMSADSPAILVLWKLGTVGLASVILLSLRHRRLGELGAVLCCTILVWLTFRWEKYSESSPQMTEAIHTISETSSRWVQMSE